MPATTQDVDVAKATCHALLIPLFVGRYVFTVDTDPTLQIVCWMKTSTGFAPKPLIIPREMIIDKQWESMVAMLEDELLLSKRTI